MNTNIINHFIDLQQSKVLSFIKHIIEDGMALFVDWLFLPNVTKIREFYSLYVYILLFIPKLKKTMQKQHLMN